MAVTPAGLHFALSLFVLIMDDDTDIDPCTEVLLKSYMRDRQAVYVL